MICARVAHLLRKAQRVQSVLWKSVGFPCNSPKQILLKMFPALFVDVMLNNLAFM